MHLMEVAHIASDLERARTFLQTHNILRKTPPNCPTCERAMREIKSAERNDKLIYRCPSHKSRKMSIRAGSILSRSQLSLSDFIFLLYFWSVSTPSRVAIEMLKHSSCTVLEWYNSFEGVCTMYLKENSIQSGETGHSDSQEQKQKKNPLGIRRKKHQDEILWRELRGRTCEEAFENILTDIGTFYPVP